MVEEPKDGLGPDAEEQAARPDSPAGDEASAAGDDAAVASGDSEPAGDDDPSLTDPDYQDPALLHPDAGRFAHLDFPEEEGRGSEEPDAEEPAAQDGVADSGDAEPESDGRTPLTGGVDEEPADVDDSTKAEGEGAEDEPDEPREMTFLEHLEELRVRMMRCLIAVLIGMGVCYAWAEDMFHILMRPMLGVLGDSHFIYTYPAEAFFTYMKTAVVAGLFLVSPYLFYQLWRFVAPGLYAHERRWLIPIAFFSSVFFVSGALFGYFIVFPFGFEFFAGFTNELIQFMPKMDEYFSFALKMLFAFGIIFEMPLFVFFLARLGLVTGSGMRRFRKYMVLINFIAAAILTPPDVISQSLMAGPLVILYEVSIIVASVFGKKPKPVPAEESESGDSEEAA